MAQSIIVSLIMLSIVTVSLELQGNYRFWDSVSDQIVYDYSGQNHHGVLTQSYFFTDRGFTTGTQASFTVETSYYASNIQQAVLSFWINCPDSATNISIESTTESRLVKAVYNLKANPMATVLNTGTETSSKSVKLYKEWNLYTAVFQCISITQVWDVKLHINLQEAYYTKISSYLFTINKLSVNLNISPSRKNIIYEIWWHTGLSTIADLAFMISSKGNPTSPTEIDLPNHENKKNTRGHDCSKECRPDPSCNNNDQCLILPNTTCKYGLYQISTFDCLFFCPDDSCICSTPTEDGKTSLDTSTCGCKAGYKKVSSNPPAV